MTSENPPFSIDQARTALDQWNRRGGRQIFAEVLEIGEPAGQLLAEQVARRIGPERVLFVAALGDVDGGGGIAELREVARLEGPGTRDLRCAALLALSKRIGEGATSDLLIGLSDRDSSVRYYSVVCLAAVGRDDAWDRTLELTSGLLKRPRKTEWAGLPEVAAGICYLAAYATNVHRIYKLVNLVKTAWAQMSDNSRKALRNVFPELMESGENAEAVFGHVESVAVQARVRHLSGLFRAASKS